MTKERVLAHQMYTNNLLSTAKEKVNISCFLTIHFVVWLLDIVNKLLSIDIFNRADGSKSRAKRKSYQNKGKPIFLFLY